MWRSYLIGIVGVVLAVLFWVAVQRFVRKTEHLPPDCDMLEISQRCHQCRHQAACRLFEEQKPPDSD